MRALADNTKELLSEIHVSLDSSSVEEISGSGTRQKGQKKRSTSAAQSNSKFLPHYLTNNLALEVPKYNEVDAATMFNNNMMLVSSLCLSL